MKEYFIDYSKVFNFLKYSVNLEQLLTQYNFIKIDDSYDILNDGRMINYKSVSEPYNYKISFIGGYRNVLDYNDDDPIARLVGYSNNKEFVPHMIYLEVETYVSELLKSNHYDDRVYRFSNPEKIRIAINLEMSYIINECMYDSVRFKNIIKANFEKMIKEIKIKYHEDNYKHYHTDIIHKQFNPNNIHMRYYK